jgi:hypothetical protein
MRSDKRLPVLLNFPYWSGLKTTAPCYLVVWVTALRIFVVILDRPSHILMWVMKD